MTQSLLQNTQKKLPAKTPSSHKKILESLASQISQEDIHFFTPILLREIAATHSELSEKRKLGLPQLRVYKPEGDQSAHRKTIVDLVNDDMAFLVDSIVAEINHNNFLIDFMIHPVVYAQFDKGGKVIDISLTPKSGYIRQSHIHVQIKDTLSDERMKTLEKGLHDVLNDVYIANRDWIALLSKLKNARDELSTAKTKRPAAEIQEYCAFLYYLYNNNFTLLGYREYEFKGKDETLTSKTVKGQSLGLLSDDVKPAYISESEEGLPRNLQELRRSLPPVSISKTNRLATVHRMVPMDAVAIKTYDKSGQVTGEKLFLGLFTSVTYSRSVSDVPYLRQKVEDVMAMSNFLPGSHDRKAMRHILEKYPRDELFQISNEELHAICLDILRLQERQRIALFVRHDRFGRYISCLVYVPRERFGTALRRQIGKILETELDGTLANFYTNMDDSLFARVMFTINISQKKQPRYNVNTIEAKLREAGQTWQERLNATLFEAMTDQDEITNLTLQYGEAFPSAYTSRYAPKQAIFDIHKIREAVSTGRISLDLYKPNDVKTKELRLKVYNLNKPLNLSDVMPILENMGLRAISELPFEIKPANMKDSVWIQDFLLKTDAVEDGTLTEDNKINFETAFSKIWYDEVESDGLNKLVLSASLSWRETIVLRTYVRYLKQIGYPFSRAYIHQALTQHPKLSSLLVDLFQAAHNPANGAKAETLTNSVSVTIEHELEKVESLDQDRILRNMKNMVLCTLRTNYYQAQENGEPKSYLSVKLDSTQVEDLPDPRPYRETFVYSPRVEAIHLRGDKIARGGIRWSDRHEDFRTEVLGLLKAQMVKNAVIVPMGAKGGFVVKAKIKDRKEYQAEGIECYKTLVRGLLDLADNLKGTKVIPPKNVVRRDGDDPYLVVAADKGTATFSDIANKISLEEYGFWLGDAFASGGSAGYDHKKVAITARGAWECIKLHFRQLNHNTQTHPFDVIGVGDMGGDVFGNGMLQSDQIRLVGTFNHIHIFCDPDPDPASTFKERERLFKAVAGWDEYNTNLLSKGGRIYNRNDKILELTPEIQQRFDIGKEKVTPHELIRAILRGRTDLLYFGGIGTYVKSSDQSHADVGDKTNESLRVDANMLRAKVVGEGANLAVTQRARVEFAEGGGKINTDFIDNSGGVDCSDHEVNIKILFSDIMSRKNNTLTLAARNKLLESMTEEVADLVLRDNYQQGQAISLIELQSREGLQLHEELIHDLERDYGLSRHIEGMPTTEMIHQRMRLGKGLTRPEICVLFAYSKIGFSKELLASDIPDHPDMQSWLIGYFPNALQKKYAEEIAAHKLSREIIATTISNSFVNRMGATFVKSRMKKTGASAAEIAKAYITVRDAFKLRELWDSIEALDNKVPAQVQLKAMREIADLAKHSITWFLMRRGRKTDMGADIRDFSSGIETLTKNITKLVGGDMKRSIDQRIAMGKQDGLPPTLSERIAHMPILASACDIIRISLESKADLKHVARIYFEIGQHFHLEWLRQQARFMTSEDPWHMEAISGLIDQFYSTQAALTVAILKDIGKKQVKEDNIVNAWLENSGQQLKQLDQLFSDLRRSGTVDLPMLIIAEQRLRNLSN